MATTIKVAVCKETASCKVGLTFFSEHRESDGKALILVNSIATDGLFNNTRLRVGMQIESVNGVPAESLTLGSAMKMLREAEDVIEITAKQPETPETNKEKQPPEQEAVLVYAQPPPPEPMIVEPLEARLEQKVNMMMNVVEEVDVDDMTDDDMPTEGVVEEGKTEEAEEERAIAYAVQAEPMAQPVFTPSDAVQADGTELVTITVTKESAEVKAGVSFKKSAGEGFLVSNITPGGLFSKTDLRVGMHVVSVNGIEVADFTLRQLVDIIKATQGTVTMVVQQTNDSRPLSQKPAAPGNMLLSDAHTGPGTQSNTLPPSPDSPIVSKEKKRVTVTAVKDSPETKVGLSMQLQQGTGINITRISEGSLFDNTELEPGMSVVSINGIDCAELSTFQAVTLVKNATGKLTIVAEHPEVDNVRSANHVEAVPVLTEEAPPMVPSTALVVSSSAITVTAFKETPGSKVGITLVKNNNTSGVVVSKINEDSIFSNTDLEVGMQILGINSINCVNYTPTRMSELLREANAGPLTLEAVAAVANNDSGDTTRLVTVTVEKASLDAKVGLGIVQKAVKSSSVTGQTLYAPVINSIAEDGLCKGTDLEVGMRILSIGGIACRGRDDAIAMLRVSHGSFTIVAGTSNLVMATVTKSSPDTKVGLNMIRDKQSQRLLVSSLPETGLFAKTDLEVSMAILQINGVDCGDWDPNDAKVLIQNSQGTVTVLAAELVQDKAIIDVDGAPPGAPAGGVWGTAPYAGPNTFMFACFGCIICGLIALLVCCCPMDERALYQTPDRRYYDIDGRWVDFKDNGKFRQNPPQLKGPKQIPKSAVEESFGPNYKAVLIGCALVIGVIYMVVLGVIISAGWQQ